MGANRSTPTERLRELGEKVLCSGLPRRLWRKVRILDGQVYIGTPSGVIRCSTVRQLSAEERWDKEFVLSIKGFPWSPDGERAGDVNIRVDLPESGGDRVRIRRMLMHQSSQRECTPIGRCARGLVSPPNVWVAVPFRNFFHENHTERCRERIEHELEKEPEGASKVPRDRDRIKRARDMRIEDTDQLPDREVIEGTGASSSRDGAGHEPPSRPAESSAKADQPPREQSDLESNRRGHRESVGEERETKRVRFNVFDGEDSDVAEEEWV